MTFFDYTRATGPLQAHDNSFVRERMDAPRGSGSDTHGDGEVMIAEPKTKVKRPPMYKVILLNDDYTPMDFVVTVIEQIFRKSHTEAMELMFTVHKKGAAVVAIYTRDVAETKVDQVVEYARINEYPLQCIMEQE